MADIKISELGAASAVNNTDLFPITSNGVTVKATAQQIKNYMGVGNIADLNTTDKSSAVAAINEVNTKLSKTEVLISIVENGNTCTHTGGISKGQYVNWKGNLYTADSNISVGATFASSGGSKNLTAVVDGGLNALNKFAKLTGNLANSATLSAVVNYPTGFSYSNSVLISLSLKVSGYNAFRMGEGLSNVGKRIFAHMDTEGIRVYNDDSSYFGNEFVVVIMRD